MRRIHLTGRVKHKATMLLPLFLLAFLLAGMWPLAAAAGPASPAGDGTSSRPGCGILDEAGRSRPYYSPDAAGPPTPEGQEALERVKESVPAQLLPQSLLEESPRPLEEGAGPAAEEGFEAAGAGGWTTLNQPYLPSGHADVTYDVYTYGNLLDDSGRMRAVYNKSVWTDIGQPPDAAAFVSRNLRDHHFTTFTEGAWDPPGSVTQVTGLEDSDLVWLEYDSRGYVHIVYGKWTWGRDASRPAGTASAYQHEGDNLWYRYVSPNGFMSAPRQLTGFTGSWAMLGADFTLQGDRIYGTFTARRNNETTPSSYRAVVGMLEGYLDNWEPLVQLDVWDYNDDPGQVQPILWPTLDVSDLGGEVTMVYTLQTRPGALYTGKVDVYACVRSTAGAWSGPSNVSHAASNQGCMPYLVWYRNADNSALVLAGSHVMVQDATHPPRDDVFVISQSGGAWNAPVNVTRAAAQQSGNLYGLNADAFGNMHFCYAVVHLTWAGGSWQPHGADLEYARLTGGSVTAPAVILPYLFHRYPDETSMELDSDACVHIFFKTLMYDGTSYSDYTLGYSTNAPGGDPGSFSPAAIIRTPTAYTIQDVTLSVFPDGDLLASWYEKGFDGGGNPILGRMYSRYRDGAAWGPTLIASSVPGNTDMLHVNAGFWPCAFETEVSGTGEQQAVFETAKYDVPTATWYDFRKYFTETVGGAWTTPQLISSGGRGWLEPALYADGGQRYFVACDIVDAATGKDVLFATQQRQSTPPASTYFFAEGTTRDGFDEWLCVENSGEADINTTVTYMLETGANVEQAVNVPAHSRVTVNVNDAVGPGHDVSARVAADGFIVAERPMYFDYYGWKGGHCVMGARETSRLWYFAEGTTRPGFEEYLTLQNPSDGAAHVDITYVLGDGTTLPGALDIAPRSRGTVNVNTAIGPGRDVSLVVESDTAVVAERPMYFDYNGSDGGHCEMGSTSLAGRWYFAEGTTRDGFDTFICLQNPYGIDAQAELTFILEDGTTLVHPLTVPATSRRTVRVNDVTGPGRDVSTVVESSSLLLAERPMYFDYHGICPGGHVAAGARSPRNAWFLAEGTTRAGFEEWLSMQNPGDVDATASLSMMLDDGTVRNADVPVPAHTRVTVAMADLVEPDRDVSVLVQCDRAIVVERPVYFLYHGAIRGGHDVAGL